MLSPSCHALWRGWGYLGLGAGEASAVHVASARIAPTEPFAPSLLPLTRERRIAFDRATVVYTDARVAAGAQTERRTVKATTFGGLDKVYLPREDFHYETALRGADQFFTWTHPQPWQAYLAVSDEGTAEVSRSDRDVRQVATDGAAIAWAALTAAGGWTVRAAQRASAGGPQLWTLVQPAWAPACGQAAAAHVLEPAVCGRRVYAAAVGGGRSRVLAYDLDTGTASEAFPAQSGAVASVLSPLAWHSDPQSDPGSCTYAALEVPGGAAVVTDAAAAAAGPFAGSNGGAAPTPAALPLVAPTGGRAALQAAAIVVETPERRRFRIGAPLRAAGGAAGAVWGLAGGGGQLFALVAQPGGGMVLAVAEVSDPDAVAVSVVWSGASPAALHSAIPGAVVLALAGGLHLIRGSTAAAERAHLPPEVRSYNCSLEPACLGAPLSPACPAGSGGRVGLLAGFVDAVVWSTAGGPGYLLREDLDKDNDGLFDKQDRFPLAVEFTWDEDNDGEPDERDLIRAHGDCTGRVLTAPGDCISDLVIMYAIWGSLTALLLALSLALGSLRQRDLEEYLSQGLAAKAAAAEADEEEILDEMEGGLAARPEREPVKAMPLTRRMAFWDGLEMFVQACLVILTVFSVMLVFVPMWELAPLASRTTNVFAWVDCYTMSCFLADLIFRYIFREDDSETCLQFLCRNWYDIPSLWTDPPGLSQSGTGLDLLVITRLLRMMRLLRVFRVLRLYRRVAGSLGNQASYVRLVLQYTQWLVPIIVFFLVIIMSVFLKIVEQSGQPDSFSSYWDCVWFSVVTVTTVGYGDRSPQHWVGRVLSCLMMVCGIGMIGNVTARVSEGIQASGTNTARAREREGLDSLWDNQALRSVMRELSVVYNPLLAIKDMHGQLINMRSKAVVRRFGSDRFPDVADAAQRVQALRRTARRLSVVSAAAPPPDVSVRSRDQSPDEDVLDCSVALDQTEGEGPAPIRRETAKDSVYQRLRAVLPQIFQKVAQARSGLDDQEDPEEWSVPASAIGAALSLDREVNELIAVLEPEDRLPLEKLISRLNHHPRVKRREVTFQELVLELETMRGLARRGPKRAAGAAQSGIAAVVDAERFASANSEAQKLITKVRQWQQQRATEAEEMLITAARHPDGLAKTLGVRLSGLCIISINNGAAKERNVIEFSMIREVNGQTVTNVDEMQAAFERNPDSPLVTVRVIERPVPLCADSLQFIFLKYKLEAEYKGIEDCRTLQRRLACLIYQQPVTNGLVVEKLFAIGAFEEYMGEHEGADPAEQELAYDWQDPIEERFYDAEEMMLQHGIGRLENGQEIIRAVQNQILRFDRVENMRWMLHHLQWGNHEEGLGAGSIIPRPPLVEERFSLRARLDPRLHIPHTHTCPRPGCDHKLTWQPPTLEMTLTLRPDVPDNVNWDELCRQLLQRADVPADMLRRVCRVFPAPGASPGSGERLLLVALSASPSQPHFSVRTALSRACEAAARAEHVLRARQGNHTLTIGSRYMLGEPVEGQDPDSGRTLVGFVSDIIDGQPFASQSESAPSFQWDNLHSLRSTGDRRTSENALECDGQICQLRRDRERRVQAWPGLRGSSGLRQTVTLAATDLKTDTHGYLQCEACGFTLCNTCAQGSEDATLGRSARSRSSGTSVGSDSGLHQSGHSAYSHSYLGHSHHKRRSSGTYLGSSRRGSTASAAGSDVKHSASGVPGPVGPLPWH